MPTREIFFWKKSEDYRTSSQWSYPLWAPDILALDRRVQQLTRIPMTHAEQIQVNRTGCHSDDTTHTVAHCS